MSAPVSAVLNRNSFPKHFIFRAASSAFQVEGACREGGRVLSIWDIYCEKKGWEVGKAIDHYHRYKEDVALMKWMGLDAYRFSISWSRILPTGKKSDGKNEEGVKFYRDLINELEKNGITSYVTLFHWDVPQALEDKYGGFRDPQIFEDFKDYVDICFTEFGRKVKYWITLNEPWSFSESGYATCQLAPGRGEVSDDTESTEGDPAKEPYIVTHHQLLAHAKAVELYRTKYKGVITSVLYDSY